MNDTDNPNTPNRREFFIQSAAGLAGFSAALTASAPRHGHAQNTDYKDSAIYKWLEDVDASPKQIMSANRKNNPNLAKLRFDGDGTFESPVGTFVRGIPKSTRYLVLPKHLRDKYVVAMTTNGGPIAVKSDSDPQLHAFWVEWDSENKSLGTTHQYTKTDPDTGDITGWSPADYEGPNGKRDGQPDHYALAGTQGKEGFYIIMKPTKKKEADKGTDSSALPGKQWGQTVVEGRTESPTKSPFKS